MLLALMIPLVVMVDDVLPKRMTERLLAEQDGRAGLRRKGLKLYDKAQALGREALAQIASVATPATLLRSDPNLNVSALIIFQTPSAPHPRNG